MRRHSASALPIASAVSAAVRTQPNARAMSAATAASTRRTPPRRDRGGRAAARRTGSRRSGRPCPGRRCPARSRAPARTARRVRVRVDVAARGQADAAGDRGARSVMMSPNRLSVTITSNRSGSVTRKMAGGVDVQVVEVDLRELGGDLLERARPEDPAWTSTLVLCTRVSFLRGRAAARANASRTTRSTPMPVLTLLLGGDLGGVPSRRTPPAPAYGPSVPSRTTTQVDVARLDVGQRRAHARVELRPGAGSRSGQGRTGARAAGRARARRTARSGRRRRRAGWRRARASRRARCPAGPRRCGASAPRRGRTRSSRPRRRRPPQPRRAPSAPRRPPRGRSRHPMTQ